MPQQADFVWRPDRPQLTVRYTRGVMNPVRIGGIALCTLLEEFRASRRKE